MRLTDRSCDVVVVGGGVAGICAAVASARRGAATLLVDENQFPGGCAVIGMHRYICGLYDLDGDPPEQPHRTLNGGLVREVCRHLFQRSPGLLPEKMGRVHVLPFRTDQLIATFHHLAQNEPLLEPFWGCRITAVKTDNQKIASIYATKGEHSYTLRTSSVVDCSGDAVVSRLSGSRMVDDKPHLRQMAGFSMRVTGLKDPDKMISLKVPYVINQAVNKGIMPLHVRFTTMNLTENQTEAVLKLAIPSDSRESDTASAKKIARETHHFLTTRIRAFADSTIAETSSRVVQREGARMMGKYLLTAKELLSGKRFHARSVINAWPIEFWHPQNGPQYRYPKGCYDIPEGCCSSLDIANLFSGGRCISVTADALGSTRVMGTCMSLGEQAGRLAAEYSQAL